MRGNKMSNIVDYIKWRGDLTFQQAPFNEVDNLVFSELAYFNFLKIGQDQKMNIKEVIENYLKKYDEASIQKEFFLSKNPVSFLKELQEAKRFKNLKVFHYVHILSKKEEKQFSAISIELNYNTVFIAFKGTDNTLFAWKEDFNLSFMSEIPSQLEAVKYINQTPNKYRNIIIGGHSKGGNLAVYAAANCKKKYKRRIKQVYNNDGPGFLEEFILSKNYNSIIKKINTIVPETSIIGMLLTKKGEYKVIKSRERGIWQHDALTWQVEQNHFVSIKEVDETSSKISKMLQDWLAGIPKKERELFINSLFLLLDNCQINTIESLSQLSIRKISSIVKGFNHLNEENKKIMSTLLKDLVKEARKNFGNPVILKGIKAIGKKY